MRHGHISQRLIAKAEIELAKYGYHWALAIGGRARARSVARGGVLQVGAPAEVKAAYRRGDLAPGDLVEGSAILSPFASIYKPRAYSPEYLLSQMPGPDGEVFTPRVRAVVQLPALADGRRIAWLYPQGKRALVKTAFPGDLREALTRDYDQVPVVLPAGLETWTGPCSWRARLQRLSDADALKLGGVAGPLYGTMEERGLTLFLSLEGEGCSLEQLEPGGSDQAPFAGSLFLEARITGERADEHLREALQEEIAGAVETVFGGVGKVESTQVMSRLLSLMHRPVIAVQRAPHLLSLFLPCNLAAGVDRCADDFEVFIDALIAGLRANIEAHRHTLDAEIDFAYDCRRPFFAQRGAMRTALLDEVVHRRPHLVPVRDWLTG